jgi:nickel and cobalt resistance protein CnrR
MSKNLLVFLAVALIAAASSLCTHAWFAHRAAHAQPLGHEWLHRELGLTPEQLDALKAIESKFESRERELTHHLHMANRDLAKVISEEKGYTPRVAAAVEAVHHHMGELQKASLEHVFEMRRVLTPEQGEKLLKLVADTLEHTQ